MRLIDKALSATVVATVTFRALVGCGSGLPSATDQAAVASYSTALEGCIVQAKAYDAGLNWYEACAKGVDKMWGVVDAGGDAR